MLGLHSDSRLLRSRCRRKLRGVRGLAAKFSELLGAPAAMRDREL